MNWSDMSREQQQALINAEKNRTNGPLPYTPTEAAEAAKSQDVVNRALYEQRYNQAIFAFRDSVHQAMRNRRSYVRWDSASFVLNPDSAEFKALQVIMEDLKKAGWHVHAYAKIMYEHSTYLTWSTKKFTWWDKLWM